MEIEVPEWESLLNEKDYEGLLNLWRRKGVSAPFLFWYSLSHLDAAKVVFPVLAPTMSDLTKLCPPWARSFPTNRDWYKWLEEQYSPTREERIEMVVASARSGDLDMVKWAIDRWGPKPTAEHAERMIRLACGEGHGDVAVYLMNRYGIDPDGLTKHRALLDHARSKVK